MFKKRERDRQKGKREWVIEDKDWKEKETEKEQN